MKEELNGKIMMEIAALRQKTYNYLTDDNNENKKVKSTSKCTINRKLKFEDYKRYLEATQLENKTNQLEKKLDPESLKEFRKSYKLILKSQ